MLFQLLIRAFLSTRNMKKLCFKKVWIKTAKNAINSNKKIVTSNKIIYSAAKEDALSMGRSHKSERAKARVLMRELAGEFTYVSGELKKADSLISLAAAEELAHDYRSAIKDYTAAFEIAKGIAETMKKASAAYGGLADVVQDAIRRSQTGVVEIQIECIALGYSHINDRVA